MKVVVLSHRVPFPPNKGEKIRTFHQLQYLVEMGCDVHVWTLIESEDDRSDCYALADKLGITVKPFLLPAKIPRYLRGLVKGIAISESFFHHKALLKDIGPLLAKSEPAIVLCTSSAMAQYILPLSRETRAKHTLLMDFMDVDSDKWRQYTHMSKWPMSMVYRREQLLIEQIEAKSIESFDSVFLISDNEVALINKRLGPRSNVHVLANGVDLSAFYPAVESTVDQDKKTFNLLFAGVMDYKPNVDAVLWFVDSCWDTLKQQIPHATFTIAGMNPSSEVLVLKSKDGIEVTGKVGDILPYFHSASLFIAPFRLARGVQNKILQAMACRLAVVTTSQGAEGIQAIPSRDLMIADSAEQFVDILIDCANDIEKRNLVAKHGFELVQNQFTWKAKLAKLQELLHLSQPRTQHEV